MTTVQQLADAGVLDELERMAAAVPTAEAYMPYAPDECPECDAGDVWVTPYVDGTAVASCGRCGWHTTLDPWGVRDV